MTSKNHRKTRGKIGRFRNISERYRIHIGRRERKENNRTTGEKTQS